MAKGKAGSGMRFLKLSLYRIITLPVNTCTTLVEVVFRTKEGEQQWITHQKEILLKSEMAEVVKKTQAIAVHLLNKRVEELSSALFHKPVAVLDSTGLPV